MKSRIWFDLAKLLVGFILLWAVFVYLPNFFPADWKSAFSFDSDVFDMSIEQEEKLGEFILDNILDDAEEIENPFVDSVMWEIESRLLNKIGTTEYEYRFKLVDDPLVNAVTLPGGNIIVFRGLLDFAETPEEVAAVLAHEIAHVEKRHVVQKLVTELGLTFLVTVITGGDATLIHEISRTLISGVFSRSQESEADEYGMNLMLKAQIDPRSLAAFFRKLNRENMGYDEHLEWLMSHPHNNARIKSSLEFEVPDSFVSQPINVDWEAVQEELK
ncbi:MAG: M48 family metallopeptidase [Flavobacteriales bacterium]